MWIALTVMGERVRFGRKRRESRSVHDVEAGQAVHLSHGSSFPPLRVEAHRQSSGIKQDSLLPPRTAPYLLSRDFEVVSGEGDGGREMRNLHRATFTRSVKIPQEIVALRIEEEGADLGGGCRVRVGNEVCARHEMLAGDQPRTKTGRREDSSYRPRRRSP